MSGRRHRLGAAIALALCACTPPQSPASAPLESVTRVTFAGAAAPRRIEPPEDGAMRDCARCHADRAAEHAGSLHAQAFTNPIFEAAYADEPLPSCRHCHAPRWTDAETEPLAALGVDCWTCHVRQGQVVGAQRRPGSPHRGPVDPQMSEATFCAGCHEFAFTDDVDHGLPPRDDLAQSTFSEWTRSAAAAVGVSCVDCHMASGDHTVSVRRRPDFVRSAFDVDVQSRCVEGQLRLHVRLTARDVGHAVPTGDLFRAIVVRADTLEGNWAERALQRRFVAEVRDGPRGPVAVRASGADHRIPEPGFEASAELDLSLPATSEVWLSVRHRSLPPEVAQRHGILTESMTQLLGRRLLTDPESPCATPAVATP